MHAPLGRVGKIAAAALVAMLLLPVLPLVHAQEFDSTSFKSSRPLTNIFGGSATSTNFSSVQTGGQAVTGEATSTNFTLHSGFLYFDTFTPRSQNWRWYDDEGSVTPTSDLAAENSAPVDVVNENIVKLRVSVAEIADIGAAGKKFRLQFATSTDFLTNVSSVVEAPECSGSSRWCYAYGAGVDNATITTGLLSDADSCVASVGDGCGTHNESGTTTSTFVHKKSAVTEYEFTLKPYGAAANTVYFFRLVDVTASTTVPLNTGESYPSITTEGAALTFSIAGLATTTATEGMTTDVSTTPTAVPFGRLQYGVSTIGAQRLTVSTNANQGYKVYVFERQPFENGSGVPIDPVTSTNPAPEGWSTGCSGGAFGCWGYHTSEDVLDGSSTRFAPNDTYARFSSTPYEVAFSDGPVTSESVDMLYRVQVQNDQDEGDYSSAVVYIVTPVF